MRFKRWLLRYTTRRKLKQFAQEIIERDRIRAREAEENIKRNTNKDQDVY